MKIVYRAGNITEAEIVKGMLLSNNIDAFVSGYYLQGGIGEIAPIDLAKVHISNEDFEQSREIIAEYEGQQIDRTLTSNLAVKEKGSILFFTFHRA